MSELIALDAVRPDFPNPETALNDPDGLLAVGGNLLPETLISAYRQGIFPWFEDHQPVLWWSPSVRGVFTKGDIYVSRSLAKAWRNNNFQITTDFDFEGVVAACAEPRRSSDGTWITTGMQRAYARLHRLGHAHSLEVWREGELIGGLYGVCVGSIFCGESMFSRRSNASKIALVALAHTLFSSGFRMIDCQLSNPHLESMGSRELPRSRFLTALHQWRDEQLDWPKLFVVNI